MPFQSEKQRRYLWSQHPKIAERWTREHGSVPVSKLAKKKLKQLKEGKNGT